MDSHGDPSQPWPELAPDYERARSREDSLDRLVEWPAQRDLLGDVTGRSVLDVGCGNGGKLAELVGDGATAAVGVDVSGNFLSAPPPGLELIRGDLKPSSGPNRMRPPWARSISPPRGSPTSAAGTTRSPSPSVPTPSLT
ncbi:DUF1698 domain-containing protein [Actinopolymorpha sp. B11F2]|uniref:DUF1698 domain-containing protein n=1 Tax=Actinopolymorpha sp. B11F2 TaxID=3160862 RepID=UPI0032E53057